MLRFPPKNILVATDLSEASYRAFPLALDLANRFRSTLKAIYVEPASPVELAPYYECTLRDAKYRDKVASDIRRRLGERTEVTLREGGAARTILELARQGPDLLVMGTHGRTGVRRLLLGSVTEAVVRLSPVPVLTTRGAAGPIRSVLAPVNFTGYSDLGLAYAAGVAASLGAKLSALHVSEGPITREARGRFSLASLPAWARKVCRPRIETRQGRPVEEILAATRGHDLVVLVAHRRGPVQEIALGTTVEQVLRRCSVPVLAVPSPDLTLSGDLKQWFAARSKGSGGGGLP